MEEQQRELDDYPEAMQFEVQVFTSAKQVFRTFQSALKAYKQELKGATAIVLQSAMGNLIFKLFCIFFKIFF